MTNWLNSPKEELFCSKDELMNCKESLLCVIYKGGLRKCSLKKFQAYKKRKWYNEPSSIHYLDSRIFKIFCSLFISLFFLFLLFFSELI